MKKQNIYNYGEPIELVTTGRRFAPSTKRTCVTFGKSYKKNSNNTYLRLTVSSDIAKHFKDKRLEIVKLGDTFALTPDDDGRFYISGSTISGINTATLEKIKEIISDSLDEYDKCDAVKINEGYFFPHVPLSV